MFQSNFRLFVDHYLFGSFCTQHNEYSQVGKVHASSRIQEPGSHQMVHIPLVLLHPLLWHNRLQISCYLGLLFFVLLASTASVEGPILFETTPISIGHLKMISGLPPKRFTCHVVRSSYGDPVHAE
jgi:hypothetical protein